MLKMFFLLLVSAVSLVSGAQVLIHAHNDYQKPQPLTNALDHRVFSVEADVFLVGQTLVVAHTREEIDTSKTLEKLYLEPIRALFKEHHNCISSDTGYRVNLVIDIKEKGIQVINTLTALLKEYGDCFDRNRNPAAVQVVLSGDRTAISGWNQYPAFLFFDGRPYEQYDSVTLRRVAFISGNFTKYADKQFPGNTSRLKAIIDQAHALHKPIRFWAAPDNTSTWTLLHRLGADIINTDRVAACSDFFR